MSEEINVNVLVDAKIEYTKQLINFLAVPIYQGISKIYEEALNYSKENGESNTEYSFIIFVLRNFQALLKQIPKWNQDTINNEYQRIVDESRCEWLGDLIKAVFIANVKILSAVRLGTRYKKIQLEIPDPKDFIHKCYIEVARGFYSNPYLMSHKARDIELYKNKKEAWSIISGSIEETIRKLLPVHQILKEYLGDTFESDETTEDITSPISNNEKDNLQKIVQKELDSMRSTTPEPAINDVVLTSDNTLEITPKESTEPISFGQQPQTPVQPQQSPVSPMMGYPPVPQQMNYQYQQPNMTPVMQQPQFYQPQPQQQQVFRPLPFIQNQKKHISIPYNKKMGHIGGAQQQQQQPKFVNPENYNPDDLTEYGGGFSDSDSDSDSLSDSSSDDYPDNY